MRCLVSRKGYVAMRNYEGVLLMDPGLDEEGVNEVRNLVEEIIKKGNGEVGNWERWGRRKLAYKIKGKVEAIYVLLTFNGAEKIIDDLKKTCGLSEKILRYIFLRKK